MLIACSVCIYVLISVLTVMLGGLIGHPFLIFPKFPDLTKDRPSCTCTGHNLPKFNELMAFVNFSNFFGSKKVKKTGCDFADAKRDARLGHDHVPLHECHRSWLLLISKRPTRRLFVSRESFV